MDPGDGHHETAMRVSLDPAVEIQDSTLTHTTEVTREATREVRVPTGQAGSPGVRASGSNGGNHRKSFWQTLGVAPTRAILLGLLLATVFGALGAVASKGNGSTTYTSTTVMIIDDPLALATAGDQQEFVKLDALRVKYSGLISTDVIAVPVAHRLHLSVGAVLGAVSTQVPFEGLLMDVDATWSSPREAQVLSQAVANEVTSYVTSEDVTYNIPQIDRFTFTTVDPASPATPQTPSSGHALTFAIGLAVLGFVLGYFATQLVRYVR